MTFIQKIKKAIKNQLQAIAESDHQGLAAAEMEVARYEGQRGKRS